MEFPKYPRHLEPDERLAVLQKAARDYVQEFAEANPHLKITETTRKELENEAACECRNRWSIDRIAELEKQLAGAMKKISRLSKRLMAETER